MFSAKWPKTHKENNVANDALIFSTGFTGNILVTLPGFINVNVTVNDSD